MSLPQPKGTQYRIPDPAHCQPTIKLVTAHQFHAWNLRNSRKWVEETKQPYGKLVHYRQDLAKLEALDAPEKIIRNLNYRISLLLVLCKQGKEAGREEYMRRQEISRRVGPLSDEEKELVKSWSAAPTIEEPKPDAFKAYEDFQRQLAEKYGRNK